MLSRFTPAAVSFVVLLTTYWMYALLAVPWIEPVAERPGASLAPFPNPPPPGGLREGPLGALFPEGSWELDNPKVLESDSAMLLLREYETLPDGRVRLTPCTMIFYSGGEENAAGRRPIVIQAPDMPLGDTGTMSSGHSIKINPLISSSSNRSLEMNGIRTIRMR